MRKEYNFKKMKRKKKLTKEEFEKLKASGMLWEFYPEAPEFFEDIK